MPCLPIDNGVHLRKGQAGADGLPAVRKGAVGFPTGGGADAGVLGIGEDVRRVPSREGAEDRPFRLDYHHSAPVRLAASAVL